MSNQTARCEYIQVWGEFVQMQLKVSETEVETLLRVWGGKRPDVEGFSATVYDLLMAGF